METVKLKTFYDLLVEGKTVAQLATAVETHGVSGWDRFGRFGQFAPSPRSEAAARRRRIWQLAWRDAGHVQEND